MQKTVLFVILDLYADWEGGLYINVVDEFRSGQIFH